MKKEELNKLKWQALTTWDNLQQTCMDGFGNKYVSRDNVLKFVDNICLQISLELDISFEDVKTCILNENLEFIELKEELFDNYLGYGIYNPKIVELMKCLKVPQIEKLHFLGIHPNVATALEKFNCLTDYEKTIFFKAIKIKKTHS